ncbi:hypothetical protein [Saccharothrix luteola]|nr:hypothetical protein [Saccharothrix luteola]MCC8245343.1 hypothetical protein [Saccharothrix luteola]
MLRYRRSPAWPRHAKSYAPTGIFSDSLHVTVPFEIDVDLTKLLPGR